MSEKPKTECGPKILFPHENNEYPDLARFELLKQELQKIIISKRIREDASKVLDDANLKEDFQKFLAGQISPEFRKELQDLTRNIKVYKKNQRTSIETGLVAAVNLFALIMSIRDNNYEFNEVLIVFFSIAFVAYSGYSIRQNRQNNKFSGDQTKTIRENTAPMKDRGMMEQLYDYLFCVYQVKHIGAKYSFSGNREMSELGRKMEKTADSHKKNIAELMAIMEDTFNQSGKDRDNEKAMSQKIKTYLSTIELLALLHQAKKFTDVSILTEDEMRMLN